MLKDKRSGNLQKLMFSFTVLLVFSACLPLVRSIEREVDLSDRLFVPVLMKSTGSEGFEPWAVIVYFWKEYPDGTKAAELKATLENYLFTSVSQCSEWELDKYGNKIYKCGCDIDEPGYFDAREYRAVQCWAEASKWGISDGNFRIKVNATVWIGGSKPAELSSKKAPLEFKITPDSRRSPNYVVDWVVYDYNYPLPSFVEAYVRNEYEPVDPKTEWTHSSLYVKCRQGDSWEYKDWAYTRPLTENDGEWIKFIGFDWYDHCSEVCSQVGSDEIYIMVWADNDEGQTHIVPYPDGRIEEWSEEDNQKDVKWDCPVKCHDSDCWDLPYINPSKIAAGQSAEFTLTMKNIGSCDWSTDYKLVLTEAPVGQGDRWPLEDDVPSEGKVRFEGSITAPSSVNTYTYKWRMADAAGNYFGETCEETVEVISKPDLNIIEISNIGNKIHYQIKNSGGSPADPSYSTLYVDGTPVKWDRVGELTPGDVSPEEFAYNWRCTGDTDVIKVCADTCEDPEHPDWNNRISESNERNCMEKTFDCDVCKGTLALNCNPHPITSNPKWGSGSGDCFRPDPSGYVEIGCDGTHSFCKNNKLGPCIENLVEPEIGKYEILRPDTLYQGQGFTIRVYGKCPDDLPGHCLIQCLVSDPDNIQIELLTWDDDGFADMPTVGAEKIGWYTVDYCQVCTDFPENGGWCAKNDTDTRINVQPTLADPCDGVPSVEADCARIECFKLDITGDGKIDCCIDESDCTEFDCYEEVCTNRVCDYDLEANKYPKCSPEPCGRYGKVCNAAGTAGQCIDPDEDSTLCAYCPGMHYDAGSPYFDDDTNPVCCGDDYYGTGASAEYWIEGACCDDPNECVIDGVCMDYDKGDNENTADLCKNFDDDDCDGLIDCEDPDCAGFENHRGKTCCVNRDDCTAAGLVDDCEENPPGTNMGGGICKAINYECIYHRCESVGGGWVEKRDYCTGTHDRPAVIYYNCADTDGDDNNDACKPGKTIRVDECDDAVGYCQYATNYKCEGIIIEIDGNPFSVGKLSSDTSTGWPKECYEETVDRGFINTSVCSNNDDGSLADTCVEKRVLVGGTEDACYCDPATDVIKACTGTSGACGKEFCDDYMCELKPDSGECEPGEFCVFVSGVGFKCQSADKPDLQIYAIWDTGGYVDYTIKNYGANIGDGALQITQRLFVRSSLESFQPSGDGGTDIISASDINTATGHEVDGGFNWNYSEYCEINKLYCDDPTSLECERITVDVEADIPIESGGVVVEENEDNNVKSWAFDCPESPPVVEPCELEILPTGNLLPPYYVKFGHEALSTINVKRVDSGVSGVCYGYVECEYKDPSGDYRTGETGDCDSTPLVSLESRPFYPGMTADEGVGVNAGLWWVYKCYVWHSENLNCLEKVQELSEYDFGGDFFINHPPCDSESEQGWCMLYKDRTKSDRNEADKYLHIGTPGNDVTITLNTISGDFDLYVDWKGDAYVDETTCNPSDPNHCCAPASDVCSITGLSSSLVRINVVSGTAGSYDITASGDVPEWDKRLP